MIDRNQGIYDSLLFTGTNLLETWLFAQGSLNPTNILQWLEWMEWKANPVTVPGHPDPLHVGDYVVRGQSGVSRPVSPDYFNGVHNA